MSRSTVIITGATKGLGRELALTFARGGHAVVGTYATDEEAGQRLQDELRAVGGLARVVRHDVSNTDSPQDLWEAPEIQQAESLTLINNATATFTPRPYHLIPWDDFARQWEVSVHGSWLYAQAIIRRMVKAGHGTIVNVLTRAVSSAPPKGFAAYITAKHALRGLTLALAEEFRHRGVRVFTVSPGFMATSLTAAWEAPIRLAVERGGPTSEPGEAARRIWELVASSHTPGRGEDYPL